MRAAFIRPNPYNNKMLHHRITSPSGMPQKSSTCDRIHEVRPHICRPLGRPSSRARSTSSRNHAEMMLACMSYLGGVVSSAIRGAHRLSRIAPAGCTLLEPHDRHFDDQALNIPPHHPPEQLFQRNAGSRSNRRGSIKGSPTISAHKILWRPTTPIPRVFPGAPKMMLDRLKSSQQPSTGHAVPMLYG